MSNTRPDAAAATAGLDQTWRTTGQGKLCVGTGTRQDGGSEVAAKSEKAQVEPSRGVGSHY